MAAATAPEPRGSPTHAPYGCLLDKEEHNAAANYGKYYN